MDLTLPVTGGSLLVIIGGYLGKQAGVAIMMKARRWDKHLEDCQEKAISHGRLEERVKSLDEKVTLRFDAMNDKVCTMGDQMDRIERKLK